MQYLDNNSTFWIYKLYADSTFYFDNISERNIFSIKKSIESYTLEIIVPTKKFQRL
jgi:hypothetical protein